MLITRTLGSSATIFLLASGNSNIFLVGLNILTEELIGILNEGNNCAIRATVAEGLDTCYQEQNVLYLDSK
jgi:hypothetical protein